MTDARRVELITPSWMLAARLARARGRVRYLRLALEQAIAWMRASAAVEECQPRRAELLARASVLERRLACSRTRRGYDDVIRMVRWAGVDRATRSRQ